MEHLVGGPAGPVADDRPIVALHGFTLRGAMFAELARELGRSILAPDLPGHGATDVAPVHLDTAVEALAEWVESLDDEVHLAGYSQGGRIALLLALEHPRLIRSLTLISTSPGIGDESERTARRHRDEGTAQRIERLGLGTFLDVWLAQEVFGTGRVDTERRAADRAIRESNHAAGIAAALRGLGQGTQPYLADTLDRLAIPCLFIAGADDPRYATFAREMAAATGGTVVVLEGATHNVVLEQPGAVAAALARFVDDVEQAAGSGPTPAAGG